MTREDKLRITRLLGIGVRDVRDLHIGDLGYANGWYPPFADGTWMNGGIEIFLHNLCREQDVPFVGTSKWSCDHHYRAGAPYNVSYSVDSSG